VRSALAARATPRFPANENGDSTDAGELAERRDDLVSVDGRDEQMTRILRRIGPWRGHVEDRAIEVYHSQTIR
jgi:hypothetical protein